MASGVKWLPVAIALASLFPLTCATEWTASTYPNPLVDIDKCGRGGKKSWICDADGLVAGSVLDHVEGELKKIYSGISPFVTKPCGSEGWQGFQVAVAIMGWFQVPPGVDPGQQAEKMAKALHDKWGVGNAACNNGVLLLLAVYNRQVYLSTGAGALPYLSNQQAKNIIDKMKPLLRQSEYGQAVDEAVVNIGLALAGRHIKPPSGEGSGWFGAAFFAAVAGIFACSCFSGLRNNRRYKTCKEKLDEIKRDQQAIMQNRYVASTCPICLDPFAADDQAKAKNGAKLGKDEDARPTAPPLPSDESAPLLAPDESTSASSSGRTFQNPLKLVKPAPAKKPLYLRCGHGFCEPCIAEWMKTKSSCPICRKDVTDDDPPEANRPRPPHRCSDTYYQELYYPELAFRMRRMRVLYPDYITSSMMNSWEQDLEQRRDLNTDALRQFELNDPATRSETTRMGSSGASSSFGGGHSSGGGGSGSSW